MDKIKWNKETKSFSSSSRSNDKCTAWYVVLSHTCDVAGMGQSNWNKKYPNGKLMVKPEWSAKSSYYEIKSGPYKTREEAANKCDELKSELYK